METLVQRERDRCVSLCRRRAELWRQMAAHRPVGAALEEARARANEAAYLADLLESGSDLSGSMLRGENDDDASRAH
jgi:hypothetical protein